MDGRRVCQRMRRGEERGYLFVGLLFRPATPRRSTKQKRVDSNPVIQRKPQTQKHRIGWHQNAEREAQDKEQQQRQIAQQQHISPSAVPLLMAQSLGNKEALIQIKTRPLGSGKVPT